jgi:hypothetical protein
MIIGPVERTIVGMPIDWGASDFDWRDAALDGDLAREYLEAQRHLDRAHPNQNSLSDIDGIDAVDTWAEFLGNASAIVRVDSKFREAFRKLGRRRTNWPSSRSSSRLS